MSFPFVALIPATYTPYAKEAAESGLEQLKQKYNPKIVDDRLEPNGDRLIFFANATEQARDELRMALHLYCGIGEQPRPTDEFTGGLVFTGVGGDTYEYTSDMLLEFQGILDQIPSTQYGQHLGDTDMTIYTNQTYLEGEPVKKKVKSLTVVVIYE